MPGAAERLLERTSGTARRLAHMTVPKDLWETRLMRDEILRVAGWTNGYSGNGNGQVPPGQLLSEPADRVPSTIVPPLTAPFDNPSRPQPDMGNDHLPPAASEAPSPSLTHASDDGAGD